MKIALIIEAIEEIASPIWQADWDRSGVQVASAREDASCLGVFLDPLPEMVARALAGGAEFLLCHHPLALKPDLPRRLDSYYEVLSLLMKADVGLYAAHTSLDVNLAGPAGWLGRELALAEAVPLEKIPGAPARYGYGECGLLPAPAPFGQLVNRILKLANVECGNIAGPQGKAECRRVAYCGGSGASLMDAAKRLGADLYVTGDIKYHAALEARLPVLDIGHHSIEEEMARRLAIQLAARLPGMKVEFFPSQSPFRRACQ